MSCDRADQRVAGLEQDVMLWIVSALSELTGIEPQRIALNQPLHSLGLGSRDAVWLSSELEQRYGVELAATLAWERPTIAQIAAHVAACSRGEAAPEESAALALGACER